MEFTEMWTLERNIEAWYFGELWIKKFIELQWFKLNQRSSFAKSWRHQSFGIKPLAKPVNYNIIGAPCNAYNPIWSRIIITVIFWGELNVFLISTNLHLVLDAFLERNRLKWQEPCMLWNFRPFFQCLILTYNRLMGYDRIYQHSTVSVDSIYWFLFCRVLWLKNYITLTAQLSVIIFHI